MLEKKTEQISKDPNVIKRLLTKPMPTYAQIAATESPMSHHETPTNHRKVNTDNNKPKKQQCEKLIVTITATAAPDTMKHQLRMMKDLIQKVPVRIRKIHSINKLSNDEYRLLCETEEDPQLLSKMDWSLIFNRVKVKKCKYGLVLHEVPKKNLD